MAGDEPFELTDVHLDEATPDDAAQHWRRIRASVNPVALGPSRPRVAEVAVVDDRVPLMLFCIELTLAGILVALLGGGPLAVVPGGIGFLLSFRAIAQGPTETADAVD